LRNAVRNAKKQNENDKEKVFRVLAPVKAELESLKKEARDEETLKMIESLEKEVEGML